MVSKKNDTLLSSIGIGALCLLIGGAGCESKFSESSATSVQIKGVSLQERLSQKEKVDSRIEDVERAANQAKTIIGMFRKVQNPTENADVYTPIDFLLDVNVELKSKMPENKGDHLVRYGKIVLPFENLSDNCKTIDTMLVASSVNNTATPPQAIGERLTYMLRTCGSNGQYLDAIVAEWIGSTLEFKLVNKNMEEIFNNVLLTDALKDSSCKVSQGEKKILDTISCDNLTVQLSKSETGLIENLMFSNSGNVRFSLKAKIYENAVFKAVTDFTLFSNGEQQFKATKLADMTAADLK